MKILHIKLLKILDECKLKKKKGLTGWPGRKIESARPFQMCVILQEYL